MIGRKVFGSVSTYADLAMRRSRAGGTALTGFSGLSGAEGGTSTLFQRRPSPPGDALLAPPSV